VVKVLVKVAAVKVAAGVLTVGKGDVTVIVV